MGKHGVEWESPPAAENDEGNRGKQIILSIGFSSFSPATAIFADSMPISGQILLDYLWQLDMLERKLFLNHQYESAGQNYIFRKLKEPLDHRSKSTLAYIILYLSIYAHRIAILERSWCHNHEEAPNSCQVMQRVECRRHHSGRGEHPEMFGAVRLQPKVSQ